MDNFVTIKDLNLVTDLEDTNRILIDNTKDRDTNTVLLSVLKQYLSSEIKPSISSEGTWIIGGVDTGVNAKAVSFDNKEILDKFSLDTDGFLLYDGKKIATDIKISGETNNILENKQDGLFAARTDLSDCVTKDDIKNGFNKIMDEEIEYGEFSVTAATSIVPNSGFVIDNIISGNLKLKNGGIHLSAGKIYKISVNGYMSGTNSLGGNFLNIYNLTNKIVEKQITSIVPNSNTSAYYQTDSYTFYKPETDCDISFSATLAININTYVRFIVEELKQPIINNISIDKIKPDGTNALQDTPIGHILSHIGFTAPKHYLICDGSEYPISEYFYLAEYFKCEFGSYNYYGGDGITTFAVPDMRGEFIRGYDDQNLQDPKGSTRGIGKHQDATTQPIASVNNLTTGSFGFFKSGEFNYNTCTNMDKEVISSNQGVMWTAGNNAPSGDMPSVMTTRPTNVNVLFCIKFEPTYYVYYNYGGIKRSTLWEGFLYPSQLNLRNSLTDRIDNYDYILIGYKWNNASDGMFGEYCIDTNRLINLINNPVVGYHVIFAPYASLYFRLNFSNNLKEFYIAQNGTNNEFCITNIIGVKSADNQVSTLIEGGIV